MASWLASPRRGRAWLGLAAVLATAVAPVVAVEELTLSVGRVEGEGWAAEGLRLRLDLSQPGRLALEASASPATAGVTGGGRIAGTLQPAADGVAFELRADGVAASDGSGLREAQGLALEISGDLASQPSGWRFRGRSRLRAGELYLDPLYLGPDALPVELEAEGSWDPAAGRLDLTRLRYRHPGALDAQGSLRLAATVDGPAVGVTVDQFRADLGPLYATYLQPFARGTTLDRLEAGGHVAGALAKGPAGAEQFALELEGVTLRDRDGRFGIDGLQGTVAWRARGEAPPTRLRWEGGHVYRIGLGAGSLEGLARGSAVRLTAPLELPVLDGGLRVDTLELANLGSTDPQGRIEAVLTPISLERLTGALGWPPMGGSLSGIVPGVEYRAGRAKIEGALLVRVFDGEVVIHNLVLETPFGPVPRLQADVDLRDLALDPLTRAFSFGNIEGRLAGWVRGLRLEGWEPVAFDAQLHTPLEDRSRHRISRSAVDDLASLGGASAALSRTFLGMLETFSYDRLGLTCRLERGICEMDGVAPANGGYYIVRGSGIPRIDVVGFNRRVDWDTLVERLKGATRAGPPVVR